VHDRYFDAFVLSCPLTTHGDRHAFFLAVATYFWKESIVTFSNFARNEVLQAQHIELWMRQLNFNLRTALGYTAKNFVLEMISRSRSTLATARNVIDGLLYGGAALSLRAGLQVSSRTRDLWLTNACVENAGLYYDLASGACQAFRDGLLATGGLLGAFHDYAQLIEQLVDLVAAAPTTKFTLNAGSGKIMQQLGLTCEFGIFERVVGAVLCRSCLRCGRRLGLLHLAALCVFPLSCRPPSCPARTQQRAHR
jgi:hypothetical protein